MTVDDRKYPGLFAALSDPKAKFERTEIRLSESAGATAWAFLRPFRRLRFGPDGPAEFAPTVGPAERMIARWLPRERFGLPKGGVRRPWTLAGFVETVRLGGYVPFGVALELYGTQDRLRLELDLVDDVLRPDPRAGRFPESARIPWPSRSAWALDRLIGRSNLPPSAARLLEMIAEIEPSARPDLPSVGSEAGAAIQLLAEHHLLETDPDTGRWRLRREALTGGPAPPAAKAMSPVEIPALRRRMNELLAEADARATCPMCGEEFPPGPHGLLCRNCDREILGRSPR